MSNESLEMLRYEEIINIAIKLSEIENLLKHPNILIRDTTAICYSTFSSEGMVNKVEGSKVLGIKMVNGLVIKLTMIRDIKETICNASGRELSDVMFTKVRYSLVNIFNLFSITKIIISD